MSNQISNEQASAIVKVANIKTGSGSLSDAKVGLTVLTSLTPNVFFTDIIDTLNLIFNPFDIFVYRDVRYGNRVRFVSTGVIEGKEYQQGKYTPDLMGSVRTPDYEDYSTSNVKTVYALIFNEIEMSEYFKDSDGLMEFMNKIRDVNTKSSMLERLNMFLYLFGNTNAELPVFVKTELDKSKSKILNVVPFGVKKSMKEVFTAIIKLGLDMGSTGRGASNKYNIGFLSDSVDANRKLNKSSMSEDLVLIVPYGDFNNLSEELATVYHQEFYQGQNKFYKVIEADIPTGTGYLVDKETIRLNYKIQKTTSET